MVARSVISSIHGCALFLIIAYRDSARPGSSGKSTYGFGADEKRPEK